MHIDISPYVLEPLPGFLKSSRQGALLKITFEEEFTGYADFHPWPELGDLPLFKHLQQRDSALFRRSLHYARLDGEARHKGVSLFHNLVCPDSHLMLSHSATQKHLESGLSLGFTHFKIKVGDNPESEQALLKKLLPIAAKASAKLRFDFNGKLDRQAYCNFMEALAPWRDAIDFCEDPFPYHADAWKTVQQNQSIDLACDLESAPERTIPNVQIIKPAKQDPAPFFAQKKSRLVITTYLDHPLGQLCAAYEAAKYHEELSICGLMSHLAYKPNRFSEKLAQGTPRFTPPPGPGLGFDEEFRKIPWIRL